MVSIIDDECRRHICLCLLLNILNFCCACIYIIIIFCVFILSEENL